MFTNNLKGEQGGVVLSASGTASYTSTHQSENLVGFSVIEDATFTALTAPKLDNSDDLIGKTFFAGSFIPVEATSVTVTGMVIGLYHTVQD